MGKQRPQPAHPYQGPQFGQQDQTLSNYALGAFQGQQDANAAGPGPMWNSGTSYTSGGVQPYAQASQNSLAKKGQPNPTYGQQGMNPVVQPARNYAGGLPQGGSFGGMAGYGGYGTSGNGAVNAAQSSITPIAPQGFQYAGQPIGGQMMTNTTQGGPQTNTSLGTPNQTTGYGMRYNPYQFSDPGANFTQRDPYQYSQIPQVNVADLYTPNMDIARRSIEEQSQKSLEQQMMDLNQRGMLTTGAANRTEYLNNQDKNNQLANLASQYSIAQGQSQLAEDQMRRQMDYQRQLDQAAEIYRQQGATDAQAQFLAQQNVGLQNSQAGQNLSAFGQNLGAQQQQYGQGLSNANLLMGQQGQQFNQGLSAAQLLAAQQAQQFQQALQGRQQATAEEQLANLFQRQPLEDLYRMWQVQAGPTGPTEGSAGLMGIFGPLLGAGLGGMGSWFTNRGINSAADSIAGAASFV